MKYEITYLTITPNRNNRNGYDEDGNVIFKAATVQEHTVEYIGILDTLNPSEIYRVIGECRPEHAEFFLAIRFIDIE